MNSLRLKISLTIVATGLMTALLVIATVLYAFQRFEHESTFQRASSFLARVTSTYDDPMTMQQRQPQEFDAWLRNLVLYEPDTQLYLLDAQGTVLVSTGSVQLPAGFKVALGPVQAAAAAADGERDMPYVMGDDPERMDADAVIAARALRRAVIRNDEPVSGYLYLVCHKGTLPASRWEALRHSVALPALAAILGIVGFATLLAWLVIASVTRPLRRLTQSVSAISQAGLEEGLAGTPGGLIVPARESRGDEVGQLASAFEMMLATLRRQWSALRRLDHFRREAVSNLSHDLRSPLTATVACLETLEARWAAPATAHSSGGRRSAEPGPDEHRLVQVALRNTRNAARMVQSLGDLAQLDEPEFKLRLEAVHVGELIDDIALRFGERAARRGMTVRVESALIQGDAPPHAALDIELFERGMANLIDNALKFGADGNRVTLSAVRHDARVLVCVSDDGPGIAASELPHLFDRYYQSRQSVAPATAEGGKGLGLAIVRRIAQLHGGDVSIQSAPGTGTTVEWWLPCGTPAPA